MSARILYDFAKGHPNSNELPVAELQDLFRSIDDDSLRRSLQYGQERGNAELITELKLFIERQCAMDTGSESQDVASLFITEGVSHGIDLLATVATQPGDLVLTERPTYYLIAGIFRCHGLTLGTLPMRTADGGVDLDMLENEFKNGTRQIPRLIYIIPANQNPTGLSMSIADRRKLAQLAFQYRILVLADEVYHLLDWGEGPRSARLVTWSSVVASSATASTMNTDSLYGCVSVSSFTKIFGPGVRCGWIEADSNVIDAVQNVGYIRSQGAVGPVMGNVIKLGLARGIVDRVLERLRLKYRQRCNLLCDILESEKDMHLVCRPTGGYFVWVRILCNDVTNRFLDYCLEHGVRFMPGHRCDTSAYEESLSNREMNSSLFFYARLCFAKLDSSEIKNGAEVFLKCFRAYNKIKLSTDKCLKPSPI
jgi:2-aminoadipate transaminase